MSLGDYDRNNYRINYVLLRVMFIPTGHTEIHAVSKRDTIYSGNLLEYNNEDQLFHKAVIINADIGRFAWRCMETYYPNRTAEFIRKIWFMLFPAIDYTKFKGWDEELETPIRLLNGREIQL